MSDEFKKACIETLKEGLRLALSAFVGFVLESGLTYFTNNPPQEQRMIMLAMGIRLLDKLWHIWNKEKKPGKAGESLGLFRF